jgi:hypothetical protein
MAGHTVPYDVNVMSMMLAIGGSGVISCVINAISWP